MANLDKLLAQALKLAEQAGVEVEEEVKSNKQLEREYAKKKEQDSRALDGILLSQHHVHAMMVRVCSWCGAKFQTNFCYQAVCSEECRVAEFMDHFKVDPRKLTLPQSFWEYEPVIIVEPKVLAGLYR